MLTVIGSEMNISHNALEIYLAGCNRGCPDCHNPESHAFGQGRRWEQWFKVTAYKIKKNPLIRQVWVMGGDLLCHPEWEATEFLRTLHTNLHPVQKPIMLWTGAEEIPDFVLPYVDYVKLGPYLKDRPPHTVSYADLQTGELYPIILASDNQTIVNLCDRGM